MDDTRRDIASHTGTSAIWIYCLLLETPIPDDQLTSLKTLPRKAPNTVVQTVEGPFPGHPNEGPDIRCKDPITKKKLS